MFFLANCSLLGGSGMRQWKTAVTWICGMSILGIRVSQFSDSPPYIVKGILPQITDHEQPTFDIYGSLQGEADEFPGLAVVSHHIYAKFQKWTGGVGDWIVMKNEVTKKDGLWSSQHVRMLCLRAKWTLTLGICYLSTSNIISAPVNLNPFSLAPRASLRQKHVPALTDLTVLFVFFPHNGEGHIFGSSRDFGEEPEVAGASLANGCWIGCLSLHKHSRQLQRVKIGLMFVHQ